MKPTLVIGQESPYTDSVCAAICYADFKRRMTGQPFVPCRTGRVRAETQYALDAFGVPQPQLLRLLEPTLADIFYRTEAGISGECSLRSAWNRMRERDIRTIAVVNAAGTLDGILTMNDAARFYIEDQDGSAIAKARTSYRSLAEVLDGTLVIGDEKDVVMQGHVVIAAAKPDVMEDYIHPSDIVIVGNRYEAQLCAIEMEAGCIIVCLGAEISRTIQKRAREKHCAIIATPYDIYTCAKRINQAVPVRYVMRTDELVAFSLDTPISRVKAVVSQKRMRYFPILDEKGRYIGLFSLRNLLDRERQRVIMVNHREAPQTIPGLSYAEVTERVDRQRIDAADTERVFYVHDQPPGSVATRIALLYQENRLTIEPEIAGLLCSAILTDTKQLRAPASTGMDRSMAEKMAKIAGIAPRRCDMLDAAAARR